jgi:preprotein translocase subunit SecF
MMIKRRAITDTITRVAFVTLTIIVMGVWLWALGEGIAMIAPVVVPI